MQKTAIIALAGLLASGVAFAETAPVKQENTSNKATQGACGEGKCAASHTKKDKKTCKKGQNPKKDNCKIAEGACGGAKAGEGACGGAKAGEGACGGAKAGEGACGGAKTGEAACGANKKK